MSLPETTIVPTTRKRQPKTVPVEPPVVVEKQQPKKAAKKSASGVIDVTGLPWKKKAIILLDAISDGVFPSDFSDGVEIVNSLKEEILNYEMES